MTKNRPSFKNTCRAHLFFPFHCGSSGCFWTEKILCKPAWLYRPDYTLTIKSAKYVVLHIPRFNKLKQCCKQMDTLSPKCMATQLMRKCAIQFDIINPRPPADNSISFSEWLPGEVFVCRERPTKMKHSSSIIEPVQLRQGPDHTAFVKTEACEHCFLYCGLLTHAHSQTLRILQK